MKKYDDLWNENAFLKEKEDRTERALTVADGRMVNGRATRLFFFAVLMTLASAAIICILIFFVASGEEQQEQESVSAVEEWRGAFLERSVYEDRLEASVELRGGYFGNESVWSGFLLSGGWIATSARVADGFEGRIYAKLYDGSEYLVEKMLCRDGVALLKISKDDIGGVRARAEEIHSGERTVAVGANGDIICGEIVNFNTFGVDISFTGRWEGAPLYDECGGLIGMLCSDGSGGAMALSAKSIEWIFLTIK